MQSAAKETKKHRYNQPDKTVTLGSVSLTRSTPEI
jgi:hypothetical protein